MMSSTACSASGAMRCPDGWVRHILRFNNDDGANHLRRIGIRPSLVDEHWEVHVCEVHFNVICRSLGFDLDYHSDLDPSVVRQRLSEFNDEYQPELSEFNEYQPQLVEGCY